MSAKSNKRHQSALKEIEKLKTKQKRGTLKMVAITLATVVVVMAIEFFVMSGTLPIGDTWNTIITMVIIFLMATYDGNATKNYTKARNEIREIQRKTGITDAEVKAL